MKKILLLATGGTIAAVSNGNGLAPAMPPDAMLDYIPYQGSLYEVDCRMLMQLDSSSMQPEDWPRMAEAVHRHYHEYDGFVITHGTDTMSYTAAALSYMLQHLGKPVVLTGSQLPLSFTPTDAKKNMADALLFACEPVGGVFVVFDGKVIQGTRAVKWRTRSRDAFRSINSPYVAFVDGGKVAYGGAFKHSPSRESFRLDTALCPDVSLVKLHPGTKPLLFDFLKEHYKGVVIEVFGLGGVPASGRSVVPKINELIEAGIAVAVRTQCLEEDTDLTVYEVGRLAAGQSVIMTKDMTTEATVAKLMWALGHTNNPSEVKRFMETPMAGDRSDTSENP